MVTVNDIYEFLNKTAPFKTAMNFDNSGLLVGCGNKEVTNVLLSLDITREVIQEAVSMGSELIISHHPVIFKPVFCMDFENPVAKLIEHKISAICAHTNLDFAKEGVNFHLAGALELSEVSPLAFGENGGYAGLVGKIKKEMSSLEFALFTKKALGCDGVRYTENSKAIKRVAVCSGSGGDMIEDAILKKADAFVTGEIKHSQILRANECAITVVDVGHFKSENVIIEPLKKQLAEQFDGIKFEFSKVFSDKIKYL